MKKLNVGDVYKFRYSNEYLKGKTFDPYWCFDGQFIVNEDKILVDTYWGSGSDRNYGTYEEWAKKGELTFYVNLNDTEKNNKECSKYYKQEDILNLSHQHGCYEDIRIKKGAKRDKEVMRTEVDEQIRKAHRDLEYKARDVERLATTREKIESGDLTQYL